MPKRYEAIRDECARKKGKPTGKKAPKECKTKAAKIENAKRREEGKPPMGRD